MGETWENEKALYFKEIFRNVCDGGWKLRRDKSMLSHVVDDWLRCLMFNL